MSNIHRDNVPHRSEMIRTPGTRCVLCGSKLQPSPNGIKTRLRVKWGPIDRMTCVVCPPDKEQKEYC